MTNIPSMMNMCPIPIPASEQEALQWLLPTLDQPMELLPAEAFTRAWSAIFYLYGGLHPDAAIAHGTELTTTYDGPAAYREIDARLVVPRYEQSGWPVVLAPLADEAWRRYDAGLLQDDEMYCAKAQRAGLEARMRR